MLGRGNERQVIEEGWELAAHKVRLPFSMSYGFFKTEGPTELCFHHNKRVYHRFFLRKKAIVKRREAALGVYTKDVSRHGVGFLSPVQLMPKERIQLLLPSADLQLQVTRCRRVDQACFECGASFVL